MENQNFEKALKNQERIAKTLDEILAVIKTQQPSKAEHFGMLIATAATIFGFLTVIDTIIKWIRG